MFGSSLPPVVCSRAHALVTYIDYVSSMTVSYKRQELLAHRGRLGSPPGLVGSVLLIFLVFCVVLLYCCIVCEKKIPKYQDSLVICEKKIQKYQDILVICEKKIQKCT